MQFQIFGKLLKKIHKKIHLLDFDQTQDQSE